MLRRAELGLVSYIDDLNRLTFLSDVKISPLDSTSSASSSRCQDSIDTLGKIVDSLEKDHVLITKRVVMSRRVWESNLYAQDVASFPIVDLPMKCDVMSKLIELLRFDKSFDNSWSIVLKQLQGALEACGTGRPQINQSDSAAEARDSLRTQSRLEKHLKRLSIDSYWFSNAKSPSKQQRPSLFSIKSTSSTPDCYNEDEITQKENYTKFPLYKQLIKALHQEFCRSAGSDLLNDPPFAQVSHAICHFIHQDCKKLLTDYIECRLMVK
ncbi:hypothetical protein ZYGR_0AG01600 [Zygosaccharomyces rouxii]|uniref:Uncharacterized protein n=1 Tax=Zygosaccharomyces rouxii TaxID=4956 RepID=A0A1Q3A8V0_ZYGRO|nr:hypothetical protein ZYGR_0AG01600 [Zygosaccharomyces rouxii]